MGSSPVSNICGFSPVSSHGDSWQGGLGLNIFDFPEDFTSNEPQPQLKTLFKAQRSFYETFYKNVKNRQKVQDNM